MNTALTDIRLSIVAAHEAAAGSLRDAVAHAVRAGELLTKAKEELPHGAFGDFCSGLPFAETTARGYMRLARLDPENRQRVADMPLRAALLEIAEPRSLEPVAGPSAAESLPPPAGWIPTPGHWHILSTEEGAFHVVPALQHPGLFHVSKFYTDAGGDSLWDGTRSAIPGRSVARRLSWLGLADPGSARWTEYEKVGLSMAFGMPEPIDACDVASAS